jgi:hypothetical protein
MSTDVATHSGDDLASEESEVRFGRSRVLKTLGAALFGYTAQSILKQQPAWGGHTGPPGPCYGYGVCHCCSGSSCCVSGCTYIHHEGCPTGAQCWAACYNGCHWHCCDYMLSGGTHCLCGTCVPGSDCNATHYPGNGG